VRFKKIETTRYYDLDTQAERQGQDDNDTQLMVMLPQSEQSLGIVDPIIMANIVVTID